MNIKKNTSLNLFQYTSYTRKDIRNKKLKNIIFNIDN